MIVWVAGFHPSVAGGDTGGFEWRWTRKQALSALDDLLAKATGFHNYVLAAIDVPFDCPSNPDEDEAVTAWIDANLHLIELPLQHEVER